MHNGRPGRQDSGEPQALATPYSKGRPTCKVVYDDNRDALQCACKQFTCAACRFLPTAASGGRARGPHPMSTTLC